MSYLSLVSSYLLIRIVSDVAKGSSHDILIPWEQVSSIEVITPSVLSICLVAHRFLGDKERESRDGGKGKAEKVRMSPLSFFLLKWVRK